MRTSETSPIAATATPAADAAKPPVVAPVKAVAPVAPAQGGDSPPQKELSREPLAAIARGIQEYLQRNGRNLQFSVDEATGETVITVRDAATGDVIRQIPNAEALAIAQRLSAKSGTLLDRMV